MACCVITAYVMNRIIKALDVLDLKIINIQYNDFEDPTSMQKKLPCSTQTVSLRISGMTCAACVGNIEQAISKLDGVDRVSVSLPLARATVVYNGKRASSNDIERVVQMAGYDATSGDRTAEENMEILAHSKQLKQLRAAFSSAATISSILVTVDAMRLLLPQRLEPHYGILFFAVHVLLAGWVQLFNARWIHQKAWSRNAGKLSVNMDTLISLSLILGIVVSMFNVSLQGWRYSQTYFAAGCFLTTVITAGRYLDLVLRRRSAANFTELYRLQSETALVQVRSNETYIPAALLKKNEEIILEPMSIIPCDCYVLEGSTLADEATMTGEPFPVVKNVGDFLLSGTKNLSKRVVAVVTAEQQDSSLAQLIESISSATDQNFDKPKSLDIMMKYFVTAILILACISFVIAFLRTPGLVIERVNGAGQRAMAVLAASCPCALGLATPSATMAGIDAAWAQGVLLMGGERTLRDLSLITHIVMDKTGTLTEGRLQVIACDLRPGVDQTICNGLLYLGEKDSAQSHPVGKAVFQWALQQLADKRKLGSAEVTDCENLPGKGVSCVISYPGGRCYSVHIGSLDFLQESDVLCEDSKQFHRSANSVLVHFAFNGKYAGNLLLQDTIRKEAPAVIRRLKADGLIVTMLTGDTRETASEVSATLGIPVLSARSLPHEKQRWVKSLQEKGNTVAMIGDGINDSLAQASADVGIQLSLSRTCMTGAADVVIMSPNLGALPKTFDIAKLTVRQAKWNIKWAIGYNDVSVSLASGVFERWGLVIDASLAGTLMALSSLAILGMSLLLRRRLS